jgi:large subunit ribosomal protein L16
MTRFQKRVCVESRTQGNLTLLHHGRYGLRALEAGRLPAATLEAVRRVLTRTCRRVGKIWICVSPRIAVSRKPAEVRMGKGKGAPALWISRIRRGQLLFELDGMPRPLAKMAITKAAAKLPMATGFVDRQEGIPH